MEHDAVSSPEGTEAPPRLGPGHIDTLLDEAFFLRMEGLELGFGDDQRALVERPDGPLFGALCSLRILGESGRVSFGTGWFVSPRTVITAGHCLHHHRPGTWIRQAPGWKPLPEDARGSWARWVQVIPRRAGEGFDGAAWSSDLRTTSGWITRADPRGDYGAVILPEPVDLPHGPLTFRLDAGDLVGRDATIPGYPHDLPRDRPEARGAFLYHDTEPIEDVDNGRLAYRVDTYPGQSGAPVIVYDGDVPRVVGVHTFGSTETNRGCVVTPEVAANLDAWAIEGGGRPSGLHVDPRVVRDSARCAPDVEEIEPPEEPTVVVPPAPTVAVETSGGRVRIRLDLEVRISPATSGVTGDDSSRRTS